MYMYGHSPIQTLYNKAKVYTYAFDSRERERDTQKGKKETVWSLLSFPPPEEKTKRLQQKQIHYCSREESVTTYAAVEPKTRKTKKKKRKKKTKTKKQKTPQSTVHTGYRHVMSNQDMRGVIHLTLVPKWQYFRRRFKDAHCGSTWARASEAMRRWKQ